jgi:hypothetical protein
MLSRVVGTTIAGRTKTGNGAVYTTEECVFTITTTITNGYEGREE